MPFLAFFISPPTRAGHSKPTRTKNRYGTANKVGLPQVTSPGLANPAACALEITCAYVMLYGAKKLLNELTKPLGLVLRSTAKKRIVEMMPSTHNASWILR